MSDSLPSAPVDDAALLKEAAADVRRLEQAVASVVIGQPGAIRPLLASVLAEGHVLLIGVPGLAKTLLVKTLARALSWSFKRIQFTPDLMPSDIVGMEVLTRTDGVVGGWNPTPGSSTGAVSTGMPTTFVPGPIFANLVLADEINRAPPKTQSALLEAMQEQTVTSLGRTYPLNRPFGVVATQNPIEQEGTYPLPEAQLDRFMASVNLDYPSARDEESMVMATTSEAGPLAEPVVTVEALRRYQGLVRRTPVAPSVVTSAVAIARATRPREQADEFIQKFVQWGAGPRASQHMVMLAKALAVMDGRPFASTDHVREAAQWVLRHRIITSFEASAAGIDADQVVRHVLKKK